MRSVVLGLALFLLAAGPSRAGDVHAAVAQNFARTARQLADAFTAATGHVVLVSTASTGKLYAQIEAGAPFQVFLSADAERPALLEQRGLAVPGSRFTYALGRLVLFSTDAERVDSKGAVLEDRTWRRLAIANPKLAPYGAAAREVLTRLGLWERVERRVVQGEDIAQTYQFVATGNADLGFVALAQLVGRSSGSRWLVPEELHSPLEQQAVLLSRAREAPAAIAFLAFLGESAARDLIRSAGYGVPAEP